MEKELLELGAAALRKAALNEGAKEYVLNNPVLFNILKRAADRYIGGETLDETVGKVRGKNQAGFKCSIEFMGENTQTEREANEAKDEFIRICKRIKQDQLNSTISLDLSHIGLAISEELCLRNLDEICTEAARSKTEVIIGAEGVERTDAVLRSFMKVSKAHEHLSITLQAYLHRTKDDFEEVSKTNRRVRIVKGAFETPKELSIPRGDKLDQRYLEYVDRLLSKGQHCSIATHDSKIQQAVKALIRQRNVSKDLYEFESLFGIQNEQLAQLQNEGHQAKIYFVYGREWYLYLCNRIAEYPLNIFQALNDIVD